jgi:hypothetical protein
VLLVERALSAASDSIIMCVRNQHLYPAQWMSSTRHGTVCVYIYPARRNPRFPALTRQWVRLTGVLACASSDCATACLVGGLIQSSFRLLLLGPEPPTDPPSSHSPDWLTRVGAPFHAQCRPAELNPPLQNTHPHPHTSLPMSPTCWLADVSPGHTDRGRQQGRDDMAI